MEGKLRSYRFERSVYGQIAVVLNWFQGMRVSTDIVMFGIMDVRDNVLRKEIRPSIRKAVKELGRDAVLAILTDEVDLVTVEDILEL